FEDLDRHRLVEACVLEGKGLGGALAYLHRRHAAAALLGRLAHRRAGVEADHPAFGADGARQVLRQVTGAATEVENALAGPRIERIEVRPPAPGEIRAQIDVVEEPRRVGIEDKHPSPSAVTGTYHSTGAQDR